MNDIFIYEIPVSHTLASNAPRKTDKISPCSFAAPDIPNNTQKNTFPLGTRSNFPGQEKKSCVTMNKNRSKSR